MKLKILEGLAGRDFALSVGEVTDRFSDKEAARLIKAGLAEKAPIVPAKKPETKKEWDDERMKLLDENAHLLSENDAAKAREADLVQQVESLSAFKGSVVAALGGDPTVQETAVRAPASEKRG